MHKSKSKYSEKDFPGYKFFTRKEGNYRNWSVTCDHRPDYKLEGIASKEEAYELVQKEFDQGRDGSVMYDKVKRIRTYMAETECLPPHPIVHGYFEMLAWQQQLERLAIKHSINPKEVEQIARFKSFQNV